MEPTIKNNDLLISSSTTDKTELERGQIVVVKLDHDSEELSVKRIIGLRNELLEINSGQIYIDGAPLSEPYIDNLPKSRGLEHLTCKIPDGHFFLLSDFRNFHHVVDSRKLGPISISKITDVARLRIWPPLKFF